MPINPIVKKFDITAEEIQKQVESAFGGIETSRMGELYNKSVQDF